MKASDTYQAIVEEGVEQGRVEGMRELLLHMGGKRFGEPDAATQATIAAIASAEKLEQLSDRLLSAESWSELLAEA